MVIKNAKFVISVADAKSLYNTEASEIAIAGKSNVGKSSFINYICNNGKLARTSGDPGRTRLLNYFEVNNGEFFFVDLPGYGYAKVAKGEEIELPSVNPVEVIREHKAKKEAEWEQSRIDTILRNVEAYDGTSYGQEDVPRG